MHISLFIIVEALFVSGVFASPPTYSPSSSIDLYSFIESAIGELKTTRFTSISRLTRTTTITVTATPSNASQPSCSDTATKLAGDSDKQPEYPIFPTLVSAPSPYAFSDSTVITRSFLTPNSATETRTKPASLPNSRSFSQTAKADTKPMSRITHTVTSTHIVTITIHLSNVTSTATPTVIAVKSNPTKATTTPWLYHSVQTLGSPRSSTAADSNSTVLGSGLSISGIDSYTGSAPSSEPPTYTTDFATESTVLSKSAPPFPTYTGAASTKVTDIGSRFWALAVVFLML